MSTWAKRLFDFGVSVTALALLIPLLAFISLLILVCDQQSPFYFSQRVGRGGRIFTLFKFQTMTSGSGPQVTAGDDSRQTSLGRFLRRHRLDELPQLIHVAWGQMSLVGPRPESVGLINLAHPLQEYVLSVRPGLTDPATLAFLDEESRLLGQSDPEGYYMKEIQPQKLELSAAYLKNATFLSDFILLLQTLTVLLGKKRYET